MFSNDQANLNLVDLNIPSFDLSNIVSIDFVDVFNSLSALHGLSAVGPDGLSGNFLFRGFITSLNKGTFSSLLKFSSVIPILKSGNPSLVLNYMYIFIQSYIAKILQCTSCIRV